MWRLPTRLIVSTPRSRSKRPETDTLRRRAGSEGLLMRKDLDESLCRDFPNLYADRHASMSTTCMCWGFPGDGWESLIRNLSEKLEALILQTPETTRHHYRASQCKEKFGTLRYYMAASTDEMEQAIEEAEEESARTCETCGAPGELRGDVWLYTACDRHTRDEDRI
jgi:hypothetical protein